MHNIEIIHKTSFFCRMPVKKVTKVIFENIRWSSIWNLANRCYGFDIITAGIRNKGYSTDLVNLLCYVIRTSNSVKNTMQWIIYYYLCTNKWIRLILSKYFQELFIKYVFGVWQPWVWSPKSWVKSRKFPLTLAIALVQFKNI